jgi:hypothetical protein
MLTWEKLRKMPNTRSKKVNLTEFTSIKEQNKDNFKYKYKIILFKFFWFIYRVIWKEICKE